MSTPKNGEEVNGGKGIREKGKGVKGERVKGKGERGRLKVKGESGWAFVFFLTLYPLPFPPYPFPLALSPFPFALFPFPSSPFPYFIVMIAAIVSIPSHKFCKRRFSFSACWLLS